MRRTAWFTLGLLFGCGDGSHATTSTNDAGGVDATVADGASPGSSDAHAPPPDVQLVPSKLGALWVNEGGDKVPRDDVRASSGKDVKNAVWDGAAVRLFSAKNEVVSFVIVLEAGAGAVSSVAVTFDTLTGPGGDAIRARQANGDGVFDWSERAIELFYVRYLPIRGLSAFGYGSYDERHIPEPFQRPWTGDGKGSGGWKDRPDHDKEYPEIAVPLELQATFDVAAGKSQSVWCDVYVPKSARTGLYSGWVTVRESGAATRLVPVELDVRGFALPDTPASKTMLVLGDEEPNERYTGVKYPNPGTPEETTAKLVRERHFLLAHRHRISLIGDTAPADGDAPEALAKSRFDGSLYTRAHGYGGPGEGSGDDVYSIATYGSWGWQSGGQAAMWSHADAWARWFSANAPKVEYFLYLIDESSDFAQIESWGAAIHGNPGPGKALKGFATIDLVDAVAHTPSLDVVATTMYVGDTAKYDAALAKLRTTAGRRFYTYNGHRPASGSFSTEDDGTALRELPWGQYKKGIDRWFFWESTYYTDFQNGRGPNDLFHDAETFGPKPALDPVLGMSGGNASNGDGVLFYPGTDKAFPADSYGLKGPIASLRLKHWRRGIQDVDYLTLAAARDAVRTKAIVDKMVPKAMWEYGVSDPADPTWVRAAISWPRSPDAWEAARRELAQVIEGAPIGNVRENAAILLPKRVK